MKVTNEFADAFLYMSMQHVAFIIISLLCLNITPAALHNKNLSFRDICCVFIRCRLRYRKLTRSTYISLCILLLFHMHLLYNINLWQCSRILIIYTLLAGFNIQFYDIAKLLIKVGFA